MLEVLASTLCVIVAPPALPLFWLFTTPQTLMLLRAF